MLKLISGYQLTTFHILGLIKLQKYNGEQFYTELTLLEFKTEKDHITQAMEVIKLLLFGGQYAYDI